MSGVRTAAVAVTLGAAAAGGAWLLLPADGESAPSAVNDRVPLSSATVERRDLVDRQDVDGTLGYATTEVATAPSAGTVTRLRDEGTTVRRGWSLLSVDAKATGWVLYGKRPFYRDLTPGMDDGSDVRQLERNLEALGYDPGTVDTDWTSSTTAAVEAFQEDRDLTETGTLKAGDLLVSDGPARIGAHSAEVGDAVRPGAPVTKLTERTARIAAPTDAGVASTLRKGAAVTVLLPDGREVKGAISAIGTVAKPGQEGEGPTVTVSVRLRSKQRLQLDGAPVSVTFATGSTKDALAVPVTALVATGTAEYAVQLAGSRRLVPVTLGAFAEGYVQIRPTHAGLREGDRVVVPA
jgi:peptidoglycan hydrolase-like protein with peptidoglycan-binding domain